MWSAEESWDLLIRNENGNVDHRGRIATTYKMNSRCQCKDTSPVDRLGTKAQRSDPRKECSCKSTFLRRDSVELAHAFIMHVLTAVRNVRKSAHRSSFPRQTTDGDAPIQRNPREAGILYRRTFAINRNSPTQTFFLPIGKQPYHRHREPVEEEFRRICASFQRSSKGAAGCQ